MSKMLIGGKEEHNPLARFKSYSYYHVLAVCNSTETADALAAQTTGIVDAWLHPSGSVGSKGSRPGEDLGRYAPITTLGKGLEYCILINGATDAAYTITKVNFQTLASAGAVNNDRFTSLAVEGRMEISEPKGVTFLDTIVRCCVALKKDPAHVAFMLKTFFVGYNERDEIETIPGVSPLTFVITDATGSFTEAGGTYNLEFVAIQNGLTRLPQFDKMLKMPPVKGGSLQEVIDLMQKSIDENYEKMFQCIYKQVEKANPDIVDTLKKVKYKIELNDLYKTADYKFDPSHQQGSDTGKCSEPAQISTGNDISLESAIHQMMQHCQRVEKDSREGTLSDAKVGARSMKSGTKMSYKIHTSFKSTANTEGANAPYTVVYRIEPFPNPKDLAKDPQAVAEFVEPNTIHFEYMYTGKNIDILNFDMKVNMGLAYLMTASIRNTYKDQGETTPVSTVIPNPGAATETSNRTKTSDNASTKVDIPVFFGTNLDIPNKRTTSDPAATANAAYDMTKHSSVEVLDASVKITGNLLLLHSTLTQTQLAATAYTDARDSIEDQKAMDWGYVPAYAKINVRMPAHNDDIALFESTDQSFTKEFWYDYYYFILGVEHVFEEGEFTQNLELIGMPRPIVGDSDQSNLTKDSKAKFSTEVADCYTNATKSCGSDGKGTDGANKSTTKHDQETVSQSPAVKTNQPQLPAGPIDKVVNNMSPDNVKGWDKMDPKVRSAIQNQTKGDKIPLSTYVAIAAIESGGKPGAVSSTGAAGIFQFTRGTWNAVMPGYRVDKNTPAASDPRRDPDLNAKASSIYLNQVSKSLGGTTDPTWLYMGHNLGPGAAGAVRREVMKGDPNKSMAAIYAEHPSWKPQWAEFAKANGYRADSTATDVREQIAGKYSKRLKDTNAAAQEASATPPAAQGAAAANAAASKPAVTNTPPSTASGNTAAEAANRASAECKKADDSANKDKKKAECCGDKKPAEDKKPAGTAPSAEKPPAK